MFFFFTKVDFLIGSILLLVGSASPMHRATHKNNTHKKRGIRVVEKGETAKGNGIIDPKFLQSDGTSSRHQLRKAFNREWHTCFHRVRDLLASSWDHSKLKTKNIFSLLSAFIFYSIEQQHMQYIWGRELMVWRLSKICCMFYSLWRRKGASCQDGQQCQDIRRRRRRHLCAAEPMAPLYRLFSSSSSFWKSWLKKKRVTTIDRTKTLHQV